MFALTRITEKELELVIINKGRISCKKNMEIQSGGEKMRKVKMSGSEK